MLNKKNNEKKRKIKNYIILLIVFVSCVCITLYLCKWYEVYSEYKLEEPVIRGALSEITYDDLDHYVVDNSNVILYLCTSNNNECRTFEKKFKKYVNKQELGDAIVYLNLTGINQDEFINNFNNTYPFKTKITSNYPAFIIFRDGKIDAVLQGRKNKKITITKLDNFLELNDYEEEE